MDDNMQGRMEWRIRLGDFGSSGFRLATLRSGRGDETPRYRPALSFFK